MSTTAPAPELNVPAPSPVAPVPPPSFDEAGFKRRRTQNWIFLGLLYAFFYWSRYNFTATAAYLSNYLGWTKTELGIFEFAMPLIYGTSVFVNGPLADRIGGRKVFLFGAVGATIMNLLFGLGIASVATPAVWAGEGAARHVVTPAGLGFGLTSASFLWLMVSVWAVNGYFQSFGALSIVKVNAQWFHVRERGTFAGIFGVLIRFGLILAFSGSPFILSFLPVQWVFFVPSAMVAVMLGCNYLFMQETPADAGFPGFDTGDGTAAGDESRPKLTEILKKVFAQRAPWIIAGASVMVGMVRRSVVDAWYPVYFAEVHGADRAHLGSFMPYQFASIGIAVMGIAGGFAFGMSSDRIFQGRRAPVITIGFGGISVVLLAFGLLDRLHLGPWVAALALPMLSFFVNGAHGMIGGAASMDFGGRKAAATAAGLFDGLQYWFGSTVGIGMGMLLEHLGWGAWQFAPIPFAILGAVFISRLWNVAPGKRAH